MMRAMVVTQFGGPEVLQLRDVPVPKPAEHDLLIEVRAAALNPVDFKVRRGAFAQGRTRPIILGFDVSGVVREVGSVVRDFKRGDEVFAMPSIIRDGANAEFVCVDARTAALKPKSLSHVEAATLPLVSLTSNEALQRASIDRGKTVLIHAGGGGVGHVAIQLARKVFDCRVLTTASREESLELARQCGADVAINYRQEDFVSRVNGETKGCGCDIVFDTVGGETFDRSLDCVAVNGHIITIVGTPSADITRKLFIKNATLHFEFVGSPTFHGVNPEQQGNELCSVAQMVDDGQLRPHVSRVFALKELAEAHRLQETGHVTGKIAIAVKS
jgi:NADPH2:quinone reductase